MGVWAKVLNVGYDRIDTLPGGVSFKDGLKIQPEVIGG
jgi:hypothetical protein